MDKPAGKRPSEPVQDGLLVHYLACAVASDVNVERRIEREPFTLADHLKPKPFKLPSK